jgi:putative DNA primase/helicase
MDCRDPDFKERLNAVRATYNKDEKEVKGYSGLVEKEVNIGELDTLRNEVKNSILSRQEDAASEQITATILKSHHIYTTRDDIKSEIWYYLDGIYVPNGASLIKEVTRKILEDAYTPQRVNKVIAKIEADTQIEHDEFFKNDSIEEIPIKNGILNIFSRTVVPYTPDRIFFSKMPIIYDKEKTCPHIEKFFNDVLKDKSDTKVMFELMGFCLMKDYRYEKAFMFIGDGRNGKGKTLSLIKRFLGVENCSSIPLAQITAGSTSVCELYGRLANIAGDLSNTDLKETGMFKQITGRDLITAKRKYLRDLFFENYAKVIFACNELPKVYDTKDGFWSRWMLFEFPYKFVKKDEYEAMTDKKNCKEMDEEIIDKISTEEELSGLLNIALDGLDRIRKGHGFSYSKGTEEVKDMWIRRSDSFSAFCMDKLVASDTTRVPKKAVRKAFSAYCREHKIPGASDIAMKVVLENRFGAYEHRDWDGDRENYWDGIKFKQDSDIIAGLKDEKTSQKMLNGKSWRI